MPRLPEYPHKDPLHSLIEHNEQLQEENERLKQELAAGAKAAANLREKLCTVATKLGHDVDELLADIKEITNVSK